MAMADILSDIGKGAATAGRVAGVVAEPLGRSIAEEEAGYAPEIAAEKRQRQTQLEDAAINAKAQELENQLATGEKYGTLTGEQQRQYVDAVTNLYSHPRHAATLMEKLRKAIHPQGAYAQAPSESLPSAVPPGGTLMQDTLAAMMKAKPNYQNFRTPDGRTVTIDVNRQEPDPEWTRVGTAAASTYVRSLGEGVSPADALKAMQVSGQQYAKPGGGSFSAAELSELPVNMQLRPFGMGGQVYYLLVDQAQRTATIGNLVYAFDPLQGVDLSQPLGVARVGTTATQTAPGGGQVVTGTTAPASPGAFPPRTGGVPTAPTGATGLGPILRQRPTPAGTGPAPTQARPVNPSRIASLPKVNRVGAGTKSILPDIQNMTQANAKMAQKAQPAVTAELGLYGDPQNPDAPSMVSYAKLADDPHAQQVLGEAFKLLDQQMGEISDPGILQTLGTAAGWETFARKPKLVRSRLREQK